eukprot:14842808-Alexandrium_andersonii.AAC.1
MVMNGRMMNSAHLNDPAVPSKPADDARDAARKLPPLLLSQLRTSLMPLNLQQTPQKMPHHHLALRHPRRIEALLKEMLRARPPLQH